MLFNAAVIHPTPHTLIICTCSHVTLRGVASVALRSLAIAAECLTVRREQEEVLSIFERIRKHTGWRVDYVKTELPQRWGWAEVPTPTTGTSNASAASGASNPYNQSHTNVHPAAVTQPYPQATPAQPHPQNHGSVSSVGGIHSANSLALQQHQQNPDPAQSYPQPHRPSSSHPQQHIHPTSALPNVSVPHSHHHRQTQQQTPLITPANSHAIPNTPQQQQQRRGTVPASGMLTPITLAADWTNAGQYASYYVPSGVSGVGSAASSVAGSMSGVGGLTFGF